MEEKNWIMGLWKFSDRISIEELGKLAEKWAAEDPKYLQLCIRKVSKDQMGIGFTYDISDIDEPKKAYKAYDEFFDRMSGYLKKNFGNDLVSGDVAIGVWVIK